MKNLILILSLFLVSCEPVDKIIDAGNTNMKWEYIDCGSNGPDFYRARIYGGWLVCRGHDRRNNILFIPLQNPDGWEIKSITNQNKAK